MPKSFPDAQVEAKVLRYLLVEGAPRDFTKIRDGSGLKHVARSRMWEAIRSLIDAEWVSYAYRVERTTHEGFEQVLSYPIFWVSRDALVRDRDGTGPVREWWGSVVATLGGEGVRP
jgi:hypothetical protein